MLKKQIKFTYTDYINLKDDKRYELIEGELYLVPSPNTYHQAVLGNLWDSLRSHVKKKRLGTVLCAPLDVVLSENDVVQPDILFIYNENRGIITEHNIKGAPDLVVEILSLGTLERDKIVKKYLYEKHGVKEYWIVEPVGRFIEVMTLEKEGFEFLGTFFFRDQLESPLLRKLRIPLKEIFK
ncbi:MAG TPA: Uma2 family endonuclease [Thermodesulfobacteriota bacterium]|nr:Uma2 family endonuclease [Thermodesulfobacteriota bacterium]